MSVGASPFFGDDTMKTDEEIIPKEGKIIINYPLSIINLEKVYFCSLNPL